jgi:transposase
VAGRCSRAWAITPTIRARSTLKPILLHRNSLKKPLPEVVNAVTKRHPDAQVEQWAMDEHRIGLKPIIRRVWRRKGQRPVVSVQHRYKWQYLYGFVCPTTGQTFWLLLPFVSVAAYSAAVAEFAQAVGAGPNKQVILILDQAGWHRSDQVVVPQGLQLVFLPPDSPELQPAEHLWELTDEALVNRHFCDRAALMAVQAERCRKLQEQPDSIRSRTHFHWWPEAANNLSH